MTSRRLPTIKVYHGIHTYYQTARVIFYQQAVQHIRKEIPGFGRGSEVSFNINDKSLTMVVWDKEPTEGKAETHIIQGRTFPLKVSSLVLYNKGILPGLYTVSSIEEIYYKVFKIKLIPQEDATQV